MTFVPTGAASRGAYRRRYGAGDTALLAELARRGDGELRKGALFARHHGLDYRVRFLPQQQQYVVSVVCPLAGRFRVTRKHALDRWMEAFVPAEPLHSRDSRFDDDFNVQTRDRDVTTHVLAQPANRQAIRALFDDGAQVVHLDGDRVKAFGARKRLGREPEADVVLRIVERLGVVARCLQAYASRVELHPAPKRDPVVVACWVALLGLFGLGAAGTIAGALAYPLLRPATIVLPVLGVGLATTLLVVFGLSLAVSRRSSPYSLVRQLAIVALLAVPLAVSGSVLLANGLLDGSPVATHDAVVTRKTMKVRKDHGRERARYHACVPSWWDADEYCLRVSGATYEALQPNVSQLRIRTRPGALGIPWRVGFDVLP